MGTKNSTTKKKNVSSNQVLYMQKEEDCSEFLRMKIRGLLSCIEEKSMRILILLEKLSINKYYSLRLYELSQQRNIQSIFEKIDLISFEMNESFEILYEDFFNLFDSDENIEENRKLRHAVSGYTWDIFKNLDFVKKRRNKKKVDSFYEWIFETGKIGGSFHVV